MILFGILFLFGDGLCMFPEFNDQLHYDIDWNGPLPVGAPPDNSLQETVVLTTKENEKYQCILPVIKENSGEEDDISRGPSPESLVKDTLLQTNGKKCTFRLEPYWTYELCHGEKIRQYHEEKSDDGSITKTEYILGTLTKEEVKEIVKEPPKETAGKRKVPKTKINNEETPYYSITMGNGTPCDLSNNKPRQTNVLFVCHPSARNEILSVKEVTTCEYELVVLTSTICANKAYIVKTKPINKIQCHSLDGSPREPIAYTKDLMDSQFITITIAEPPPELLTPVKTQTKPSNDPSINTKFLKGEYCLIGGSGWWKYEFCYGKFINQFHEEKKKPNTVIRLGEWNKEAHLSWLKAKKKKGKSKNMMTHFYSGGDVCDVTGNPRHAQVNLICIEGKGQQLAIYMTEDKTCEYTIGVESPILCPIVEKADENGLLPDNEKREL